MQTVEEHQGKSTWQKLKENGRIGEVSMVHTGIEASILTKGLVKRQLQKEE